MLLDTHAFLWWVDDSNSLSEPARLAIRDAESECFLSLVSCWEMAIKSGLGKLRMSAPLEDFVPDQMERNGFFPLEIEFRHIARVAALPAYHRDPFDRLLVAQALTESLTLVSADSVFDDYGVSRLW